MIAFDLSINDAEALLRHAQEYKPASGDFREDSRLRDALNELAQAIDRHLNHYSHDEPE